MLARAGNAAEPEPETEQIARQWRQQPSTAARTYKDLQRRQAAQERMRGISKGAGAKQRVSANDEPKYIESQLREMGTRHADLKGRSDLGAEIVKAAQQALSAGGAIPERIVIDGAPLKGDPGGYDPVTRTLYLQPALTPRSMRDKAAARGPEGDKTWSSSHPRHVLYHEFSHAALQHQLGDIEYQKIHNRPWFAGEKAIAAKVSRYAAKKPSEFISEYRAARMAGRIFAQPIIDLYTQLVGQRWTP